jgi:hypothetical protein
MFNENAMTFVRRILVTNGPSAVVLVRFIVGGVLVQFVAGLKTGHSLRRKV